MRSLLVILLLLSLGCGGGGESEAQQHPEDEEVTPIAKSVIIIIAPENFRDEEFQEPFQLFTRSGTEVTVASTDTAQVRGMLGMIVKPDMVLEQVVADSFDALIVVGGSGCQVLWDNAVLHALVQRFNNDRKAVAAICIAPVVLGRAGILKDVDVAAYASVKEEIASCGGIYTDKDVVVSGNIITASGPKAATDFARAILDALSK